MGIEPISSAWKADYLPLIHIRFSSGFCPYCSAYCLQQHEHGLALMRTRTKGVRWPPPAYEGGPVARPSNPLVGRGRLSNPLLLGLLQQAGQQHEHSLALMRLRIKGGWPSNPLHCKTMQLSWGLSLPLFWSNSQGAHSTLPFSLPIAR